MCPALQLLRLQGMCFQLVVNADLRSAGRTMKKTVVMELIKSQPAHYPLGCDAETDPNDQIVLES